MVKAYCSKIFVMAKDFRERQVSCLIGNVRFQTPDVVSECRAPAGTEQHISHKCFFPTQVKVNR